MFEKREVKYRRELVSVAKQRAMNKWKIVYDRLCHSIGLGASGHFHAPMKVSATYENGFLMTREIFYPCRELNPNNKTYIEGSMPSLIL
jgi:hypothetical protein